MNLKDILKKRPDKRDYYYQRQAYVEELDTFIDELEQAINFTGSSLELKVEDFHIGFRYEEYQMDSERYLNKGMIWVEKEYTLTSPRLYKIKTLIEEGKLRKPLIT